MEKIFLDVLVIVLTWIISAAIQWGIFKERLKGIDGRVQRIEDEKFITRIEYESRHDELLQLFRSTLVELIREMKR